MFLGGQRQREYSTKDMLPMSGKLIPEFDGRRSIRDMFTRKPSIQQSPSKEFLSVSPTPVSLATNTIAAEAHDLPPNAEQPTSPPSSGASPKPSSATASAGKKRGLSDTSLSKTLKRSKSSSTAAAPTVLGKGQQSLKGFFRPKEPASDNTSMSTDNTTQTVEAKAEEDPAILALQPLSETHQRSTGAFNGQQLATTAFTNTTSSAENTSTSKPADVNSVATSPTSSGESPTKTVSAIIDPIVSKESWSKLFTKPAAPRCEGHDEPCITLLTKKSGMNCGRSFWMCPRPLGPSGAKERNTQWRCQTFIWCSDWNPGNL